MSEHSEAEIAAKKMAQSDTVLVDMSPWPFSTPEDWRKEAKILREAKPSHLPAAALCDAVADAMEKEPGRKSDG